MIQIFYCNLNGQVETITMETLPIQQKNTNIDNVNTNTPSTSFTQAMLSQHKIQRPGN